MTADMKTEVETWLIANQTQYTQYFEGQDIPKSNDDYITVKFVPIGSRLVAQKCKLYNGVLRFYIYTKYVLDGDKIKDYLASLLDETTINGTDFTFDVGVNNVVQRGNKANDQAYYENIVDFDYDCWTK